MESKLSRLKSFNPLSDFLLFFLASFKKERKITGQQYENSRESLILSPSLQWLSVIASSRLDDVDEKRLYFIGGL